MVRLTSRIRFIRALQSRAFALLWIGQTISALGDGAFGVIWVTMMQEMVPADKLGRVTSIDILGAKCLTPVGYALGGLVTDRVGPGWVFIAAGALNVMLNVVALCVPEVRGVD